MCGIAGFALKGGFEADSAEREARAMADAIIHRGPDGSGAWVDGAAGIAMSHRRLSIIDLSSTGAQPMHSDSNRYVISFNGEIYNHNQLRNELSGEGIRWRGTSDTESFLAAVEVWGIERALKKTIGMFAFALWDKKTEELTLARDRMGEKPLYYGNNSGYFFFGSELKALKAHPRFEGIEDIDALPLFLRHGYIPSPYSIYKGIKKLLPGTYLTIPLNSIQQIESVPIVHYWSLEETVKDGQSNLFSGTEEEATQELEDLLCKVVKNQSAADVPIGAFLSGGIDSSTVVALMQAQSSRPVKTFTIGFREKGYDEAEHAKAVAKHLGTDHTELYVSPEEAQGVIPQLPALYDEPFADSSQIPTSLISNLTRQHVKVSLSGDGGDELFGGYNRYAWTRKIWNKMKWLPLSARKLIGRIIASQPESRWNSLYHIVSAALPQTLRLRQAGVKIHKLGEIIQEQSPDLIYRSLVSQWKSPGEIIPGSKENETFLTKELGGISERDIEQRMMFLDGLTYLPDDLLVKVDRAAMGTSLETRIPFLDHRVVELAWRLPLEMKIKSGVGKKPIRKILENHLPRELFDRPKMGFAIPVGDWLRGSLRDWAEDLLSEKQLGDSNVFDVSKIRRVWARHLTEGSGLAYQLWTVLIYQSWREANRQ